MKNISYNLQRAVNALATGVSIIVGVAGLWALTADQRGLALGLILFVAIILLLWFVWNARRTPQLGETEVVDYRLEPASQEDIKWIAGLEASVYTASDAIPYDLLLEWYSANPSGFFVVRDTNEKRVGHLDILPLRPLTLSRLTEGAIREREIRGDSLFSESERTQIKSLYVESLAITTPGRFGALNCVLASFFEAVSNICDPAQVEKIYAIAASRAGARLMESLGFELANPANARRDGHDLYVTSFPNLVSRIRRTFGRRLTHLPPIEDYLARVDASQAGAAASNRAAR